MTHSDDLPMDRTAVFDDVLAAELDAIAVARGQPGNGPFDASRRAGMGASASASDPTAPRRSAYRAAADMELTALALSGGGIRSATFNLGLLQALSEARLLGRFDYLSTVSGGGYIGSWLSAQLRHKSLAELQHELSPTAAPTTDAQLQARMARQREAARQRQSQPAADAAPADPPAVAPAMPVPKSRESAAVNFLRQYSNYLTPRVGLLSTDTLAGVAAYMRNVVLIQAMVIALLLAVLLAPRLIHGAIAALQTTPGSHDLSGLSILLVAISLTGIALNLSSDRESPWARTSFVVGAVITPGVLAALTLALHFAISPNVSSIVDWTVRIGVAYAGFALLVAGWRTVRIHTAPPDAADPAHAPRDGGKALADLGLIVAFAFAASLLGGACLWALHKAMQSMPRDAALWFAIAVAPFIVLQIYSLVIVVHVGLVGRILDYQVHEWVARYGAWVIAFTVGIGGCFAISIYGPALVEYADQWLVYMGGLAWLAATLWGVLHGASAKSGDAGVSWRDRLLPLAPYIFILGLTLALATAIHKLLTPGDFVATAAVECAAAEADGRSVPCLKQIVVDVGSQMSAAPPQTVYFGVLACLALYAFLAWRVDINLFSFHGYYRNRLTRCYLGAARAEVRTPHPFTGFDPDDDFRLADLVSDAPSKADVVPLRPYHLLNTALNISSSANLAWQQRKAGSFFFSPLYCGFALPPDLDDCTGGFVRTPAYMSGATTSLGVSRDSGPMLGSVMATSGAAASPNWGFHTNPAVAFLLTLFNVRLGRWCPNPAYRGQLGGTSPRFGGLLLLQELFGQTEATSKFVYLSDGGHFDNLGIYELVRRRVSTILVSDCGQDIDTLCDDVADTLRKCATDFGVAIHADVSCFQRTAKDSRFANAHLTVGRIEYPELQGKDGLIAPAFEGTLVIVKPSLMDQIFAEAPDVRNYALTNLEFPQQTTADQWFDEAQFESYRKLGLLIGRKALAAELVLADGSKQRLDGLLRAA